MPKITTVPYLSIQRAHEDLMPEILNAVKGVISDGVVILGPQLESFEKKFAKISGVKFVLGVANGYDALILSLLALGIGRGDEVIVPANTYIATLFAVSRVGATPVLVEPNIDTYNIDSHNIERAITKKTKAIIPVHLFGQACEMEKIMKIAKKYKLFVIEDNAQSQGGEFNKKPTGSFGNVNATSFYPGKNLGAIGDAGAITTDSRQIYQKLQILRNYGSKEKYVNDQIGYNSRLDEIQAAVLSIKIKNLKKKNQLRQKNAKKYLDTLTGIGDLIMPKTVNGATHVYHVFTIRTNKRDKLQKYLNENGVGTIIHYPIPPHLQKAYSDLGFRKGDFPIAEELASTSLSIPIFPEMTESEQAYVIKNIKNFFTKLD